LLQVSHNASIIAHDLLTVFATSGLFVTEMSGPGSTDELGNPKITSMDHFDFKVPCTQPPPEDGSKPLAAGSRTDVGALALFLVTNWFVNGETVLIDGGVRTHVHDELL
jgi:hypothetical protein